VCLIFCASWSEALLLLKRIERDIKNVQCFLCKVPVILSQILIKLEYSYIKFHTNPSSGSRDRGFESHRGHGCLSIVSVVCCQLEVSATSWSLVHAGGRTDTHDEANNRLWQILQMPLKTHMSYLWDCLTPPLLHNWYINSLSLQSCGEGIIFWGASFG